jgi:murein DD-endopeptidase MepM/ murein hydrolase activator NlpD
VGARRIATHPRATLASVACIAGALCLACAAPPRVLSRYGSWKGVNEATRLRAHQGVDFAAPRGAPVLAPADGEVESADMDPASCGLSILLSHAEHGRYTVVCHLDRVLVRNGEHVRRGQVIGFVGSTGNTAGIPHLHFQLCTVPCRFGATGGRPGATLDPMTAIRGCHSPDGPSRSAHGPLLLTYPLACGR